MKFSRIVVAVVGFAALAIGARAQEFNQLIIHIPYDFVVLGKTLPAGTYRVTPTEPGADHQLLLRNVDNAEGVLVLPNMVEEARADKFGFRFQEIGGQHFLSKIETANYVFTVPVSKSEILEATNKSHQSSKASGTSGND
jgi:hypothetical protein